MHRTNCKNAKQGNGGEVSIPELPSFDERGLDLLAAAADRQRWSIRLEAASGQAAKGSNAVAAEIAKNAGEELKRNGYKKRLQPCPPKLNVKPEIEKPKRNGVNFELRFPPLTAAQIAKNAGEELKRNGFKRRLQPVDPNRRFSSAVQKKAKGIR